MKHKGVVARRRLKEVRSEAATRRTETGYEASLVGRAGHTSQSPYPSRATAVDPAGLRRQRSSLPGEACIVLLAELRPPQGDLTAVQESAEGIVGHAVGEASEALQAERRSNG